jgi:flagellar basal body rod protein FlgG
MATVFFQVQREDGSFGYTRKGLFEMNGEGVLTDANGQPVLAAGGGEIVLPSPDIEIAPDGNIWYQGEEIGQIAVFKFEDNSILQRDQGSMFVPENGIQPELHPTPQVSQGNLEGSNVNVMRSMAQMTSNLRTFEAMQKALKIYSNMGSKASEIGLVQ